ncbi:MAG: hypothetical protein R8G66_30570 [Cytophagales bacterium]|nr:hypothetical protein [Cytophagales bacterium]
MKRKILFGLLIILIIVGAVKYFTLSDLRARYNLPADDPEKVQSLLASMANAHQTQLWENLETYEVSFSEEFYGFIGKVGNPFSDDQTTLSLKYLPAEYTGQLTFDDGEDQGLTWGIQDGQTYTMTNDKQVTADDDVNILFWLPTYQYFIEFAWRIQEATHFQYMGMHEINGQTCEGILASWNTVEPQQDIDQYIIWLNKSTGRIVKIEYTIRDMYPFLTGAASLENYQDFDGILLPTEFPVESNLVPEGLLHTMKILDFRGNVFESRELEVL